MKGDNTVMHCSKKITENLWWVGANDRRLAMFEGVYSVPDGVSYNSYLLLDEKNVLFDTVDKAVGARFLENVDYVLGGRELDYLVIHHMEPDHSATLVNLLEKYPDAKLVCNAKILTMAKQFFGDKQDELQQRSLIVKEGDTLETGSHTLTFLMAPMVHWPEVMMTYDITSKTLFSADAFGAFGALNGALFADEVNFERDYMDEARRYYTNIVGKYGTQVQAILKKASAHEIEMICPLHGFVWRRNLGDFISKYQLWSTYAPEEYGVMIAYASVYGNTENAAEILSSSLRELGIKTVMFDVSVTPASEIVSAAFKFSHLVFASTTYNAGIFVTMEALLSDLVSHNLQNRTVALIENGSWAPTSGALMKEKLSSCKNMTILEDTLTVKSSVNADGLEALKTLAEKIAETMPKKDDASQTSPAAQNAEIDSKAFFKLSYGLFVLTSKVDGKDNGCIINTAIQVTDSPKRMAIAINKANYTHDMIKKSGVFNLSVLSEAAPFKVFERFGFSSGRDTDKFASSQPERTANGLAYVPEYSNAVISCKVLSETDCGTHTLFVADVTEAVRLSDIPSMTYAYYFDHVKPKPAPAEEKKTGYVCKICGYVYEGETLPADFVCPLCKHGADDFEKL